MLLTNPTEQDVKTYVGFAMNKPSNLNFNDACILASGEFGITTGEVKAIMYGNQDLPEIQEAMKVRQK